MPKKIRDLSYEGDIIGLSISLGDGSPGRYCSYPDHRIEGGQSLQFQNPSCSPYTVDFRFSETQGTKEFSSLNTEFL